MLVLAVGGITLGALVFSSVLRSVLFTAIVLIILIVLLRLVLVVAAILVVIHHKYSLY